MQNNNDQSHIGSQNIDFYNEIADQYNDLLDRESFNKQIRQKVTDQFLQTVKSGRVLDFGGGTGLDLEWLTGNGYTVIFCEPSSQMREKAIQYRSHSLKQDKIIFLDESASDFTMWQTVQPFEEKVDAILSNFAVLNCIADIDLLFANLAAVIKPGGNFFALILDNSLGKLLKANFLATVKSYFTSSPIFFNVEFNGKKQIVYLHTNRQIKNSSSAYFEWSGCKLMRENNFILIQLVRK